MQSAVDRFLARVPGARRNGHGWMAPCPAHPDREPSLSISEADDGRVLLKCFAGCTVEDVLAALSLQKRDLFAEVANHASSENGVTLAELAAAKRLSEGFLKNLGLADCLKYGRPAVRIPYLDESGREVMIRYRLRLQRRDDGDGRFVTRKGDKLALSGLSRLDSVRKAGWVLLVEGESDCWTAWFYSLPVIGVPGKSSWQAAWALYLQGVEVYVWQEPGAEDFTARIAKDIPGLRVIVAPHDIKDLSEAHVKGLDVLALVEKLKGEAVPAASLLLQARQAESTKLEAEAASVLACDDPLVLVEDAFRAMGYGGDLTPAIVCYLAATSRLLGMRQGSMPVHLLLLGPASAGKSYALNCVLRLLPPSGYVQIDAGSPRVLIYDTEDVQHKLIVFGEADSLPAGEDNPAASAIRNLLQEHKLAYKVAVKQDGGGYAVQTIDKPGPSVLITTSTRRLGHQLDSRMFVLEVADDKKQIRAALAAQAAVEMHGSCEPDPALIAFQAYLQAKAPWDVHVPFVDRLSQEIGNCASASRVLRDFARLLSLIKAVAILRHTGRQTVDGRLVAELDDYATVASLVSEMYEASAGASEGIREAVNAVAELAGEGKTGISQSTVAKKLNISRMAASRRITAAVREGWLMNRQTLKGRAMDLELGEPLPARTGLPSVEALSEVTEHEPF